MFKDFKEFIYIITAVLSGAALFDHAFVTVGWILFTGFVLVPDFFWVFDAVSEMFDVEVDLSKASTPFNQSDVHNDWLWDRHRWLFNNDTEHHRSGLNSDYYKGCNSLRG